MKRDHMFAYAAIAIVGIGGAMLAAPGQGRFTGTPGDIINVKVTNSRNDALPVVVQDINVPGDRPLRVEVTGKPTVLVDPATVLKVEVRRPVWEYKQVRVSSPLANPENVASLLTAEGAQGWETTGVTFSGADGTIFVLKRIK